MHAMVRPGIILLLALVAMVLSAQPEPAEAAGVVALAAGRHTCALTTTEAVKCWGANDFGQLGDGTTIRKLPLGSPVPVDVVGLRTGVAAVVGGYSHTCALTTAGGVKCWGRNFFGTLGDSRFEDQTTPVDSSDLESGVSAIAAGAFHTCAVTTEGVVKCWGRNLSGQLGDGTSGEMNLRRTPVDVVELETNVAAVTAGIAHTCVLTTAGGVKCWGANGSGQLGDGTTADRITPGDVPGLTSGALAVTAGWYHTCALMIAGGVKCWGSNGYGQLGDQTSQYSSMPVDVVTLDRGVTAVAAGVDHTCAVTTAGSAKCWGNNRFGQLGDGTATHQGTPVDVTGLESGVAAVAPGGKHTCARTADSAVMCWGNNFSGELGDDRACGTTCPVAVDVMGLGPKVPGNVDCTGSVNSIDAALILQYRAGLIAPLPCQDVADVNEDGAINSLDAALILQYDAGLIASLPP